jgi:dTDP-4-amino-4,6-dideoxygalactose transaminase
MEAIQSIAASKHLLVIEDAALAVGAEVRGRKAGTMGDAGFMSLAPNKVLGGLGNGGVVVTDRNDLAEKLVSLRDDGKANSVYHDADRRRRRRLVEYEYEGFNERPDEIQAAVLRVKLTGLEKSIERRRAIARKYDEGLQPSNVTRPAPMGGIRHAYRAYTILVENRDGLADYLEERGVETAVYYAPPLHLQRPYHYMNHRQGDFPIAEEIAETMLSLPIHPTISDAQIEFVIETVNEFISKS